MEKKKVSLYLKEALESTGKGESILPTPSEEIDVQAVANPAYVQALKDKEKAQQKVKEITEETIKKHEDVLDNTEESRINGNEPFKAEVPARKLTLKESLFEDLEEPEEEVEVAEEPEAKVKIDLVKFKPWGNAVKTYEKIKEAGKLFDLEKMIEDAWPDGIEDQTLNDLLAEDIDFLEATLDMKLVEEEEPLNEAKSHEEEVNQFFIFEDAAYCFGLQNPEDSFEKFIGQFENIEFEEEEIEKLKEKFTAGVEKGKETKAEVEEEVDEETVKEIVESLTSKEKAAEDLKEKYKNPKFKEVIDALLEIFEEHSPEQAVEIKKAIEEKNESLRVAPQVGVNEIEEFSKLCEKIGLKTMEDIKKFAEDNKDKKDILTALKDYYFQELGPDFQLKESLEEVETEVEETPVPPTGPVDTFITNNINDLITGELDTIKQYNDFLLTLESEDFKKSVNDSVKNVINDIVNEEQLHIGQLQEILKQFSPNAESIKKGEEEAKEQLEVVPEEVEQGKE